MSNPTNNNNWFDSYKTSSMHDLSGDSLADEFPTIVVPFFFPIHDVSTSYSTQPSDALVLI